MFGPKKNCMSISFSFIYLFVLVWDLPETLKEEIHFDSKAVPLHGTRCTINNTHVFKGGRNPHGHWENM